MVSTVSDWMGDLDFRSFFDSLEQGGWFEYVFPFMLVYAIVFTIMNQVSLFKDKKSIKVIIALVFALFSVAFPISESGETLGFLMSKLFPGVTAFTMGILALYIVVAMLGVDLMEFFGKDNDNNNYLKWVLGGLGLIVVVYYYALGFGWSGFDGSSDIEDFFRDPSLYILILFGLFFWWVTKDEDNIGPKKSDSGTHVHVGENKH